LGKILPFWRNFYCIGHIFFKKKSPNDLGEIFAKKKLVRRLFGPFLWSLGDFFTKTSGHPDVESVDTFSQKTLSLKVFRLKDEAIFYPDKI
jgi:hypothetical protein